MRDSAFNRLPSQELTTPSKCWADTAYRHTEVQPDVVLTRVVRRHRDATWAGLGDVPWDAGVEDPATI